MSTDTITNKQITFRYYGGGTEQLRERTGQDITIIRELEDGTEIDRDETRRMFIVRFPDGTEADAFEEEIIVLPDTPRRAAIREVEAGQ